MSRVLKSLIAFIICLICFAGIAACGLSDRGDGTTDTADTAGFDETDLNGDGKIDDADYALWSDYTKWKNSENAEDYSGDRKINFTDYEIYLKYTEWKNSEKAFDMDGNGKINYDDYAIYNNPELSSFDEWLTSENAYDYDKDGKKTPADYNIYIERKDIVGEYIVSAFNYTVDMKLSSDNDFNLSRLAGLLDDATLSIGKDLETGVSYGQSTKESLETNEQVVLSAIESCKITLLSKNLMTATFVVADDGINRFTVYFEKSQTDYTAFYARININEGGVAAHISFNLIRVD